MHRVDAPAGGDSQCSEKTKRVRFPLLLLQLRLPFGLKLELVP